MEDLLVRRLVIELHSRHVDFDILVTADQLQAAYEAEAAVRELVDTARKLEGSGARCGSCTLPESLSRRSRSPELVPVSRSKNDEIVTAYDMKAVEKMGLLKMDFLGPTTLTVD